MSVKAVLVLVLVGAMMAGLVVPAMADGERDPSTAAVFSFFIPGLGQGWAGDWTRGGAIFVGETLLLATNSEAGAYAALAGWVWNIFDAAQVARDHNEQLGRRAWLAPVTNPDGQGGGLAWNMTF